MSARGCAAVALVVATLSVLSVQPAASQQTTGSERAAVVGSIEDLFDALAAKDTAALRAAFHPEAGLASVVDGGGAGQVVTTALDDFLRSVAGAPGELYEEIGEVDLQIDGPLATARTPYTFYVDGAVSHCGVNAFHFARTEDGWRIVHITDTRRMEGCGAAGAPAPGGRG